jgi:hypothetical protein
MASEKRPERTFDYHEESGLVEEVGEDPEDQGVVMSLKEDQHIPEGSIDGLPEMAGLELMFVLLFGDFNMSLFAVHAAEAGFGDLAIVLGRLAAHHAHAVPSPNSIDD